jgi:hypothetical protein
MRSTVRGPILYTIVFLFFRVCTSTYLVHTKYRPGTYWYILANVLKFQVRTSKYSVGIGTPHAIVQYRLVLLCTSTYLLVMRFTIQGILTGAEQYKAVLYYSMWCTDAALCHTKYAQSLYSEVD